MNAKHFVTIAVLVVLSVSLFTLASLRKSTPVKAEVQAEAVLPIVLNEPAVRMQSGPIHFSDNNSPDFRSHVVPTTRLDADTGCMSDENATPRRYGGCVD